MANDVVEKAIAWALSIANDSAHGYDQGNRWGPDYDCSSLVISAFQNAGVPVKTAGATYTGTMRKAFLKCGFVDVTSSVNLSTGAGLVRGDVLLNEIKHTALYLGSGQIVHASGNEYGKALGGQTGDQTGREICTRSYYNSPWDCILRYAVSDAEKETVTVNAPVLSYGSEGNDVVLLQIILDGYRLSPGPIDGEFGTKTEKALKTYQLSKGLTQSGKTDLATWKAFLGT